MTAQTMDDVVRLAEQLDDDQYAALDLGRRIGHAEALLSCEDTHDQLWWSGWCVALVIGTLSGVALTLVLQGVI
jgi:hypothetical protein